jgi:energy-coupling factor transport system ATP-binding protein
VALAGVLAMQPRYLLLDEPTSGLDVNGRRAVASAVTRVRPSTGVVIVTHDADEFLGQADRVVVLREGVQAFGGTVDELMAGGDGLERDGVWTPPDHVMAQLLAMRAGRMAGPPVLDPAVAAGRLFPGGAAS